MGKSRTASSVGRPRSGRCGEAKAASRETPPLVRFSRALCRTRTGNPFLTMAVRPWRGIRCTEPKRLHSPAKRDPADCCTDAHTSAPSGTAWVPWFRTAPPPAALDGGIQSRRTRDVTERPGGRGTGWVICSPAAARPVGNTSRCPRAGRTIALALGWPARSSRSLAWEIVA